VLSGGLYDLDDFVSGRGTDHGVNLPSEPQGIAFVGTQLRSRTQPRFVEERARAREEGIQAGRLGCAMLSHWGGGAGRGRLEAS
jgi:hypothetical protein